MSTIVVHAGMPKTGSSAIQAYLAGARDELRRRDIVVATARLEAGTIQVLPHDGGPVNSGDVYLPMTRGESSGRAVAGFVDGLAALAERSERVVVTGEGLAPVFWRPHRGVVSALGHLASRFDVRIAYYVRPQHTALEAAWRQWGFRSGQSPAEYLTGRVGTDNHYFHMATLAAMRAEASELDFVVRPFRRDLLRGADVVHDFVTEFLEIEPDPWDDPSAENVGLSLDLVNALQQQAGERLWDSQHQNMLLRRVKALVGDVGEEAGADAEEGRLVLQAWCRDRFEDDNLALIDALGWKTDHWVPPPARPVDPDIRRLDHLWQPPAAPQVVGALVRTLRAHADLLDQLAEVTGRKVPDAETAMDLIAVLHRRVAEGEAASEQALAAHARLAQRKSVRAALATVGLVQAVRRRLRRFFDERRQPKAF